MTDTHEQNAILAARLKPCARLVAGDYEVRLAQSSAEIFEAQQLRYRLLYEQRGGRPDATKVEHRADLDEWDEHAYHIVVIGPANGQRAHNKVDRKILGTLRLVCNANLTPSQGFYTEQTYDLSLLRNKYQRILELGRFCIEEDRRQGSILLLIWKYAMQFIIHNDIELMLGCASFVGAQLDRHQAILGYLYQQNLAPEELRPKPIVDHHAHLAKFSTASETFEVATRDLPTLLRGYLKLGAKVSDTAIIDQVFNTIFVCIYVETKEMLAGNTPLLGTAEKLPER